jgi:hypothetical protein
LVSDKLSNEQLLALGISRSCIIAVSEGMKPYLTIHRSELRK